MGVRITLCRIDPDLLATATNEAITAASKLEGPPHEPIPRGRRSRWSVARARHTRWRDDMGRWRRAFEETVYIPFNDMLYGDAEAHAEVDKAWREILDLTEGDGWSQDRWTDAPPGTPALTRAVFGTRHFPHALVRGMEWGDRFNTTEDVIEITEALRGEEPEALLRSLPSGERLDRLRDPWGGWGFLFTVVGRVIDHYEDAANARQVVVSLMG